MKNKEKKISQPYTIGFLCSFFTTLTFCKITLNSIELTIPGPIQLLILLSIYSFFIFTIFISEFKTKSSQRINNKKYIFLICLLFIFASISCLNSNFQSDSVKRTLILTISSTSILFITLRIKEPIQFFDGMALGIITITTVSIFFGLTAMIIDQNYVTRLPKETVIFQFAGIEFTQTIAHRAFIINDIHYYVQRYAGIIPNPNGLGLLSAISFGLSYSKKLNKIAQRIFFIISFLGIMLSFSRMGILLFLSIIIYMGLNEVNARRIICSILILSLALLITTIANPNQTLIPTTDVFIFKNIELLQLRERADLFANAWQGFSRHWLTGVGYGVGAEYLFSDNATTQAVHSVHLNALLETGLIGTITLVAVWLIPVFSNNQPRSARKGSDNRSQIIAAILFGLFIAEAFDLSVTRFHYIHLIFFFLLGIWSSLRQEDKDAAAQNVQNSETQQLPSTTVEPNRGTDN